MVRRWANKVKLFFFTLCIFIANTWGSTGTITVRGVVLTQESSAQPNARVIFSSNADPRKIIETLTDASGTFVMSLLSATDYNLRIMAPGYPLQYFDKSKSDSLADGPPATPFLYSDNDNIAIRLTMTPRKLNTSYGSISGIVQDSTGRLLPQITIMALMVNKDVTAEVKTDNQGQYTCLVPIGQHFIMASSNNFPMQFWGPGGTTLEPSIANVLAVMQNNTISANLTLKGAVQSPINGPMPPHAGISGHVMIKSNNMPVEGITVCALKSDSATIGIMNPGFNPQNFNSPYSDTTLADGSYSITNMPKGRYFVFTKGQKFITQFYNGADVIGNAQQVAIDTAMKAAIDFSVRVGGALSGKITTKQGTALGQAQVFCNAINGAMSSSGITDSLGRFLVTGLTSGSYCLNVNSGSFLIIQNEQQCNLMVAEGATLDNISLIVEQGGVIKGASTSPAIQDSLPNAGFEIALFSDSLVQAQGLLQENRTAWATFTTSAQGEFVSSAVPAGTWRYVFRPWQKSKSVSGLGQPYRECRAYSFGSATALSAQTPIIISSGDTARLPTVNFAKGYSISETISLEGGEKGVSCNITAYIKDGNRYVPVSRTNTLADSLFELAGLIDGQEYFIGINAPGYPMQFWSPQGSSVKPSSAYRFSTTAFAKPMLFVVKAPQGYSIAQPSLSALWKPDSMGTGTYWIVCNAPEGMKIDTIVLYSKDLYGAISLVVKFPYVSSQAVYSWRETMSESQALPMYVFVGKGATVTTHSNIVEIDPLKGEKFIHDSLLVSLTPARSGLRINWRSDSLALDTIILSRKMKADAVYEKISMARGKEGSFWDGSFEKVVAGTIVYYKVEITSNAAVSRFKEVSFNVTQAFLDSLPRYLRVGPYEQYKTIQAAVDAAKDLDVIRIVPGSGPYKENISLKGKVLSLEGDWQNGEPPVISGGEGVAITVPYTSKSLSANRITINGIKIINSLTGIKAFSDMSINQCLFVDNVSEAVFCAVDSSAVAKASIIDPFAQYRVNQDIWQCTFIRKNLGQFAVRASSGALGSVDSFEIVQNAMMPGGFVNINNSLFHNFPSSYLPVAVNDNRFMANLRNCDFWRTSMTVQSSLIHVDSMNFQIDPAFADTVNYFLPDSSPLTTLADNNTPIGYDGRYWKNSQEQNKSKIPAVKNFKTKVAGPHTISLSWSPLPDSLDISGYIVYRVNGVESLFVVNNKAQWEPKINKDSIFTIVDMFPTQATFFSDTTVIAGKPYIYAVAGINRNGDTGNVDMPDSLPLSAYIIKIDVPLKVNNLVAGAYGFTNVLLRWNKPPSTASVPSTCALFRFSGGDSLIAAARDSGAVRKLVLANKTGAIAAEVFTVKDTFFIDTNATLGAVHLYVATIVDTLVPLESRPLAWTMVKTDSLPYQEQRSHAIVANQWNMIGPWGVGSLAFESDSGRFIYRWNDDKVADKLYSQYSISGVMQGGAGYWFRCNANTSINVTASMHRAVVQNRDSLFIKLRKGFTGWNQVSSPLPFSVRPAWLDNGSFVAYAWDADSSQYTDQTTLEPWRGYWIYTDSDTQLPVRPSDASGSQNSRAVGKRLAMAQWELQVSLSGNGNDPDNFIGVVVPTASKLQKLAYAKPPQAFDYTQLFIIDNNDTKQQGTAEQIKLAKLYKASPASVPRKLEWMVGISPSSKETKVKVQGISKLSDKVSLYWVSGATAINLKETAEIPIKAHSENVYAYIIATSNPRDVGLYTRRFDLRGCYPNPVRRIATIEFAVPYAWNADGSKKEGETRDLALAVYDMAGRCVATVFSGKICVGEHKLVWRGSSEAGHIVAQGAYIIRLSGSDFQKTMKIMKLR